MTCIVAHRSGWIIADRRNTLCDTWRVPIVTPKIIRHANCLFASAGSAYVNAKLLAAVQGARDEDILDRMADAMRAPEDKGDGHVLVVQEGKLWTIDGHGALLEIDYPFWSIGSGYQAALGYLAGIQYELGSKEIETYHAINAVAFAAELNTDCGDGYQVETLSG